MKNSNEKPGRFFLGVPFTLWAILLVWVVLTVIYYTVGLPHAVSLPIIGATAVWFVVWLFIQVRRG